LLNTENLVFCNNLTKYWYLPNALYR